MCSGVLASEQESNHSATSSAIRCLKPTSEIKGACDCSGNYERLNLVRMMLSAFKFMSSGKMTRICTASPNTTQRAGEGGEQRESSVHPVVLRTGQAPVAVCCHTARLVRRPSVRLAHLHPVLALPAPSGWLTCTSSWPSRLRAAGSPAPRPGLPGSVRLAHLHLLLLLLLLFLSGPAEAGL